MWINAKKSSTYLQLQLQSFGISFGGGIIELHRIVQFFLLQGLLQLFFCDVPARYIQLSICATIIQMPKMQRLSTSGAELSSTVVEVLECCLEMPPVNYVHVHCHGEEFLIVDQSNALCTVQEIELKIYSRCIYVNCVI